MKRTALILAVLTLAVGMACAPSHTTATKSDLRNDEGSGSKQTEPPANYNAKSQDTPPLDSDVKAKQKPASGSDSKE